MKVVAFLPAKGSSERILSKNKRLLDGKPLFLHTLEKLLECPSIDEVYLDSEDDEILDLADYLNYKKLKRDSKLATNKTDGHQMFYNEIKQVDADIYIQILGTSPFIKIATIEKGIEVLKNSLEYDSVVLVDKQKQYTWNENGPVYDRNNIPNSIDLKDTIIETMGLYMVKKDTAQSLKQRIGKKTYLLDAEPIEAVDINFENDFLIAEYIAKGINTTRIEKLETVKTFLNSAIISDILDGMGIESVIPGLTPNIEGSKIIGSANTLKIRELEENEDYRGIYKGLETYERMRNGEIIVVENEVCDKAYFGELNANLAKRASTNGAIIGGVTRDVEEVKKIGYPVFARGYNCSDVRKRATVESFNKPIQLNGIRICPGDLIFADTNGVVVIPKKLENEVILKAIDIVRLEKNILGKILDNSSAVEIYNELGEF